MIAWVGATLESPRATAMMILVASVAILVAVFLFQAVGGLDPCVLCIYQRYPYAATIGLSAVVFGVAGHTRALGGLLAPGLLGLCGLVFAVGAGIAFYHVGVEAGWFQASVACTGTLEEVETIEDLKVRLEAAPFARCDEVPWSLFGVSLAGYNLLVSLALAVITAAAAWRQISRHTSDEAA
jgi:disulfide bond formation protein DsbB